MVSDRCNTNCFHCYRRRENIIKKNIRDCKKDISDLMEKGNEVIIAGSEILCSIEMLQLHKIVGQKYIISNGILLSKNENIAQKIIENGIKRVGISWHYGFQHRLNGISENTLLKAIRNVKDVGLEVEIHCVISNENYQLVDKFREIISKLGVRKIKFVQLVMVREELRRYQLTNCQKNIFFDLIKKARKKYKKEELYVEMHGNFNPSMSSKSIETKKFGLFCPAGKGFIEIDTDNNIYPCPFLHGEQFRIGRYDNGKIMINTEKIIKHDGKVCLAEKI